MRDACRAEPRLRPAVAGDWLPRPDWRPVTKFERRARAEGREVRDLLYYRA
jgi:tRNA (guanine-N7-)-methyltransferase